MAEPPPPTAVIGSTAMNLATGDITAATSPISRSGTNPASRPESGSGPEKSPAGACLWLGETRTAMAGTRGRCSMDFGKVRRSLCQLLSPAGGRQTLTGSTATRRIPVVSSGLHQFKWDGETLCQWRAGWHCFRGLHFTSTNPDIGGFVPMTMAGNLSATWTRCAFPMSRAPPIG